MSRDKLRQSYQSRNSGQGKKKGLSRGEFIVEASPYQDQQEESSSGTLAVLRQEESNGKQKRLVMRVKEPEPEDGDILSENASRKKSR